MTRETPPQAGGGSAPVPEPGPRRLGWQLVQIALLAALLLVGMYEVDRDARALAERRARSALLAAVESAADPGSPVNSRTALEQAVETYARICGDCAEPSRCQETIQSIQEERRMPAGRGPCKVGLFERGNGDAR